MLPFHRSRRAKIIMAGTSPAMTWRWGRRSRRWRAACLRLERAQIGGERDHVFQGQLGDYLFHQRHRVAGARAVLHVVELAHDIERVTVGDRRHRAEAAQAWAVTDGAGDGLAAAAGGGEFLALLDRARRDVVDEAGLRVARMRTFEVLRHRDDTLADRLHAGRRPRAD